MLVHVTAARRYGSGPQNRYDSTRSLLDHLLT